MYSQCYSHLTEWKDLEIASTNNIDDHTPPHLDSVWSDTYYQVSKCNDMYYQPDINNAYTPTIIVIPYHTL